MPRSIRRRMPLYAKCKFIHNLFSLSVVEVIRDANELLYRNVINNRKGMPKLGDLILVLHKTKFISNSYTELLYNKKKDVRDKKLCLL